MGLDMYLIKTPKGEKQDWSKGFDDIGSWRKAHAIHEWFVQHIQNNVDDCGYYLVEPVQLKLLRSRCKTVLEKRHLAKDLIPDKDGKYNENYFGMLENTVDTLGIVLSIVSFDSNDIYYTSSW